jgi:ferritin-like metal-binding protein YciE
VKAATGTDRLPPFLRSKRARRDGASYQETENVESYAHSRRRERGVLVSHAKPSRRRDAMKVFSAKLDNLRKLYVNQLQLLISSEDQIMEALPRMIDRATDVQLRQAFQSHMQETRLQIQRLEEILGTTTGETRKVKCKVMAALATEAEDMVEDAADESVRDAALVSAGQRVEHYEIACYGAVRGWAQLLGERRHAELLDKTIHEKGHADHLLTEIAQRVNSYAERAA